VRLKRKKNLHNVQHKGWPANQKGTFTIPSPWKRTEAGSVGPLRPEPNGIVRGKKKGKPTNGKEKTREESLRGGGPVAAALINIRKFCIGRRGRDKQPPCQPDSSLQEPQAARKKTVGKNLGDGEPESNNSLNTCSFWEGNGNRTQEGKWRPKSSTSLHGASYDKKGRTL